MSRTNRPNVKSRRWFWATIYALYLIFILLSASVYYAQQELDTRASGIYEYDLTFDSDGKIEHYDVELVDKGNPGKVRVIYNADRHHHIAKDVRNQVQLIHIDENTI